MRAASKLRTTSAPQLNVCINKINPYQPSVAFHSLYYANTCLTHFGRVFNRAEKGKTCICVVKADNRLLLGLYISRKYSEAFSSGIREMLPNYQAYLYLILQEAKCFELGMFGVMYRPEIKINHT